MKGREKIFFLIFLGEEDCDDRDFRVLCACSGVNPNCKQMLCVAYARSTVTNGLGVPRKKYGACLLGV